MNSTAKGRNRVKEPFLQRIGLELGHFPAATAVERLLWVSRHVNQKGYFKTKTEGGNSFFTIEPSTCIPNLALRLRSSNPSTKQREVKRLDLKRPLRK